MKIKVYVVDVKMPRWLRRAFVFAGVPAVILGLGALVYAALPAPVPTFTDGTVLSAAPLTSLGTDITNLDTRLAAVEASISSIPKITEWTAFTPVWQLGTTAQPSLPSTGLYRRVGDSVEVQVRISDLTKLTPPGGDLTLQLPAPLVPASSKLMGFSKIGYGNLFSSAGSNWLLVVAYQANNVFILQYNAPTGGPFSVGSTNPFDLAATGGVVQITFTSPVEGWTATTP
jgi:hypothetical protein